MIDVTKVMEEALKEVPAELTFEATCATESVMDEMKTEGWDDNIQEAIATAFGLGYVMGHESGYTKARKAYGAGLRRISQNLRVHFGMIDPNETDGKTDGS